jgi:peptide/nickel transport system permease protein
VLPGDVGRTILGPYATPQQVQQLDHKLGYDKPIVQRYGSWLSSFVTGNWSESVILQQPVRPLVVQRLLNSLLMAAVAVIVIVPISIALGIVAGLRRDRLLDRLISVTSLSLTVIPEFVSGVILLYIFGVRLKWFPVVAQFPVGATIFKKIYYVLLPAVPLGFILMGYIARMARAGVVDVLDQPYIRTAVLKGLPWRRVVTKHVLRNGLLPTVTVIGAQLGWLVGGLVVVETLFTYSGIGKLMVDSASAHDVPVLEAAVVCVAAIYMFCNLAADVVVALLNPRVRRGG